MESCANGRLFSYDPDSGSLSLVLTDLCFPNGIQLTPEEDAFIFAETTRTRLMKYYITGPKNGQLEEFLRCPGYPDNIKYSPESDVYWVGLSSSRLGFSLGDFMAPYPWMREFLAKTLSREKFFFVNVQIWYYHCRRSPR